MAKDTDYDSKERRRFGRKWGRRFGSRIRDWGEEVGERAKHWGKKVEDEFSEEGGPMAEEKKAKKAQGEWMGPGYQQWNAMKGRRWWSGWWMWPFGLIGPLIGSAIMLVFLIIALWVLKFANAAIQSQFISLLISATAANIWVFFAFSIVMGYLDFIIKRSPFAYMTLWPAQNGLAVTFAAWVIAWIFKTVGFLASVDFLLQIGSLLRANLAWVFVFFLALGYLTVFVAGRRYWHG